MAEAPTFKCSVCGAPAEAGDFSCRFCAAGIATLCCSRCFHMNMAQALHCSGCGTELGLIVESQLQDAHCSDCHQPLQGTKEPSGTLLVCRHCGGQFVEHALFRHLIEHAETAGLAIPDAPYKRPPLRAALERVRYRPCSVCGQMMNRKNFGGASGVIVDVCAKHGTWFDAGELPQVLAFVQSGGLVRERARELERERLARAHDREFLHGAGPESSSSPSLLAFNPRASSGEHSSLAADLLTFVVDVLTGHEHRNKH
ncbi:MAG: zf-TFIIB domain-containing protein [Polyangiaceae bacterium]